MFSIKFDFHSFICYFCLREFFLKKFVTSFNIKLIGDWASILSSGLEFYDLWVWKINSSLEDFSEFACSFFFLNSCFFLSFIIYLIKYWTLLCFYLFSTRFLINLENNLVYFRVFLLLFFIKVGFLKGIFLIKPN